MSIRGHIAATWPRQINSKEGGVMDKPSIFFFPHPVMGLTLC